MKLEDDETYEAPEPGEIVDEPEGKPVSGPVLNAPPPSPLPTLEALIKPRQDLVPQQRVFPLPSSSTQQSNQRNDRGKTASNTVLFMTHYQPSLQSSESSRSFHDTPPPPVFKKARAFGTCGLHHCAKLPTLWCS